MDTYPLQLRVDALEAAVRRHRDQRGDDRCWQDDEELYRALPEGYAPPARDSSVELELCRRYVACRHNPATAYVSPQRRVEELEAEVRRLLGLLRRLGEWDRLDPPAARLVDEALGRPAAPGPAPPRPERLPGGHPY